MRTPLIAMGMALLLAACSGTPTMQDKPSSEFPGLNKVSSSGFTEAWARPGAGVAEYKLINPTRLQSADAEIVQPSGTTGTRVRQEVTMTPELEQGLAEAWNNAITRVAGEQGLTIASEGDKLLRIDATMTRIAPSANFAQERTTAGRTTVYTEDSGEASIEFKVYDQASGELLAVIRDKRRVGSQMWTRSNSVTASADVRNLFNSWANTLVRRLTGN